MNLNEPNTSNILGPAVISYSKLAITISNSQVFAH